MYMYKYMDITIQVQYENKKFDCFLFWQEESGHSLVNENEWQKTRVVNNRREILNLELLFADFFLTNWI